MMETRTSVEVIDTRYMLLGMHPVTLNTYIDLW